VRPVDTGVHIDVWSDVVCPWCYLGKRRLERAVETLPWGDEVTLRWRAFQLDPGASAEPGDLRRALERKYGPGAFDTMTTRLGALGAAEGIDFRFDRAQRVGTADAHRLLAWAWDAGGATAQAALGERLLQAYFTEGANVADQVTLVGLVADLDSSTAGGATAVGDPAAGSTADGGGHVGAGLDADQASQVLASGAFADEVAADRQAALDLQITGVPSFVIQNSFVVPGAQEVDTFVRLLERARDRLDGPRPGERSSTKPGATIP
jgi:predicted DsbA family dithiol-disulfide isomerase